MSAVERLQPVSGASGGSFLPTLFPVFLSCGRRNCESLACHSDTSLSNLVPSLEWKACVFAPGSLPGLNIVDVSATTFPRLCLSGDVMV